MLDAKFGHDPKLTHAHRQQQTAIYQICSEITEQYNLYRS